MNVTSYKRKRMESIVYLVLYIKTIYNNPTFFDSDTLMLKKYMKIFWLLVSVADSTWINTKYRVLDCNSFPAIPMTVVVYIYICIYITAAYAYSNKMSFTCHFKNNCRTATYMVRKRILKQIRQAKNKTSFLILQITKLQRVTYFLCHPA